ncbi:glycoside hydrolase family 38 C-terminal domain-containing protein [Candidatus Latescibacterota bacterium]
MSETHVIHVIATQHLDVAYLWKRHPEGEDLMRQCFARALEMMDAHPEVDFVFSRSTAWSFAVLEDIDPQLFGRVRQAVADGRLELCGGQWVEPDNILPDGESLVRQSLYGQHYYWNTFDRHARVSWNPDAFAHGHTLPQLFRQAGLEAYYFHRCVPVDTDGQLVDQFLWEGLDGSRVLVLAGHWRGRPDASVLDETAADLARSGHSVGFIATGANSDRRVTMETDWVPLLPRQEEGWEARWATSEQLVDALRPHLSSLPVITGELGWQFTGTYTTEGRIKRRNRRLEALLDTGERLWAWVAAYGGQYPADALRDVRRELCVNQFHDIVCGTCYHFVHEEAFELYDRIEHDGRSLVTDGMGEAARCLGGNPGNGDGSLLLYNPLGQPHHSPVFVPGGGDASAVTIDGHIVPTQAVAEGEGLVFVPPPVPSLGFSAVELGPGISAGAKTPRATDGQGPAVAVLPGVGPVMPGRSLSLENEWLQADIDPRTGELVRLRDRTQEKEMLAPDTRGNRLVFYGDRTPLESYEPWYIGYTGEVLDGGTVEVELLEDGPVRSRVRTRRRVQLHPDQPETVLIQDILLYRELPWLIFEARGEWWADGVLLKAEFDLAFPFEEVAADMPYGVAMRPPHLDHTAFRLGRDAAGEDGLAAGTEIEEPDRPMHKWLDVSDGARGLAFLNDGRYGYDADGQRVRLSLMRAPRHRDGELLGVGPFEPFSYALYPHAGDWRAASLPRLGLAYNYPLVSTPVGAGAARSESLFDVHPDNVLLTTIKRAESGNELVLRLYESTGEACTARITSSIALRGAREANLLEDPCGNGESLLRGSQEIEVAMGAFEVKTLLLTLRTADTDP